MVSITVRSPVPETSVSLWRYRVVLLACRDFDRNTPTNWDDLDNFKKKIKPE